MASSFLLIRGRLPGHYLTTSFDGSLPAFWLIPAYVAMPLPTIKVHQTCRHSAKDTRVTLSPSLDKILREVLKELSPACCLTSRNVVNYAPSSTYRTTSRFQQIALSDALFLGTESREWHLLHDVN